MINRNQPVLLERVLKMKNATDVEEYQEYSGFEGLRKAIQMEKEAILDEIDIAHLRGRGGAAYPAGKKWRHLYGSKGDTKYIVCNADEGEPGTFKDKALLEQDPLSVIEGMVIAGYLFSAKAGYIYMRGEYRRIQKIFQEALDNAEQAGFLGENILGIPDFDYRITIISGAGAYVCGENSALLNSIEGKTGRPRVKPPHLADVGLYLKPTLVNNVESFAGIPVILREGGQAFLDLGTEDGGGTKLICLSGHVKNRGLYEVNLGTPLQEIIYSEEYGGGSATGRPLKFIHFGGQSGPIGAVSKLDDCIYSYEGLWEKGLSIGSGAIVVMDDQVSVVDYLVNVAAFFAHESCGKCTPCRLGTTRILEELVKFQEGRASEEDLERFEKMVTHVTNLSACGLGQSICNPMMSGLTHFPEEFRAGINQEAMEMQGGTW
ncbi:complex I 51 kDa subunit family protein [Enterococcus rivorum]|uniref:NADH-quinone oxidoreductase subunit F n=1 Tax=Enterococcus rivorum TaxID=762845 RepID=A0A1E5KV83_9ENTE|nr:NADH-ubiquinone oxidoreductase-F iron-sulfur binding region domain-containing protein [Enterococcus rivorum]MBP2100349.1 NADH-quinone oxidoreductase subunit F [Enterococcus rivorum]OEH81740.1 NADH-quinone oxidoreductase subunit F [Enterococcus rivorum]